MNLSTPSLLRQNKYIIFNIDTRCSEIILSVQTYIKEHSIYFTQQFLILLNCNNRLFVFNRRLQIHLLTVVFVHTAVITHAWIFAEVLSLAAVSVEQKIAQYFTGVLSREQAIFENLGPKNSTPIFQQQTPFF